jgi:hypothetical protein
MSHTTKQRYTEVTDSRKLHNEDLHNLYSSHVLHSKNDGVDGDIKYAKEM